MITMQELTGTECPTEILQLINLLVTQKSNIDLSNLSQTGQGILDGKASINLDNLSSLGQAILDKKVEVEALLQQNGYAKFSWKENNQISNLIFSWITYDVSKRTSNSLVSTPIAMNNIVGIYPIRRTSQTSLDSVSAINLFGLPSTSITPTSFSLITATNSSSIMSYYIFIIGY